MIHKNKIQIRTLPQHGKRQQEHMRYLREIAIDRCPGEPKMCTQRIGCEKANPHIAILRDPNLASSTIKGQQGLKCEEM
jgi:hypothetical protein